MHKNVFANTFPIVFIIFVRQFSVTFLSLRCFGLANIMMWADFFSTRFSIHISSRIWILRKWKGGRERERDKEKKKLEIIQCGRYLDEIGWNVNQMFDLNWIESSRFFIIMTHSTNQPEMYNWIEIWNGIVSLSHCGCVHRIAPTHTHTVKWKE